MFHRVKTDEQDKDQAIVEQDKEITEPEASAQENVSTIESNESNTETQNEEDTSSMTAESQAQIEAQDTEIEEESTASSSTTVSPYSSAPSPVVAPASYPGSYASSNRSAPAAAYTAPTAPAPSAPAEEAAAPSVSSSSGRTLTIGPGITMSGEIESCEHLVVEGTVEAALRGARVLEVEESGTYYGSVEIEEAIIAGRFEGDLSVNGRITVRSTGVITGTIAYKELQVESGAVIDGRITPLKSSGQEASQQDAQRAKERAAAISKAKEIKSKQENMQSQSEPANTDEGLFQRTAVPAE